ncbi:class I tRNA ligase family protein, partial [Thiotrichales bacterium HSG1]|nr:class I tRNA ligase family protein [Thiotrichales bacterium HSG1]
VVDIDLNLEDFLQRVNADLVGKFVNIASRCANFITKRFAGQLAAKLENKELYQKFIDAGDSISNAYEKRDYNKAVREIMALADQANQYIDEHKPWVLVKQEGSDTELQAVCSQGLNLFRVLMGYLAPILPVLTIEVEKFLAAPVTWQPTALTSHKINKFKPLMKRVEQKQIDAMIEASKETLLAKSPEKPTEKLADTISYDDFAKIDLRIAKIVKAEPVEKAKKLLKLTLDIGEDKPSTVFAGIKS